ncbi:response regulator, partial [Vibrio parahaemolyticus V-223/04]
HAARLFG